MNRCKKFLLTAGLTFMAGGFAVLGTADVFGTAGAFFGNGGNETEEYEAEITLRVEQNSAPIRAYETNDINGNSDVQPGNEQEADKPVHFDEQNGTPVYQIIIHPNEELPTPVYTGYQFLGWNKNADGSGEFVKKSQQIGDASTLYAIWEKCPDGIFEKQKKMYVGEKTKFVLKKATGKLEWSSSNPQILQVDKKGNVTAKSSGTAVVTVKQYEKEYQCKVTVKVPNWKQAYGILLSQMKNRNQASFMIRNIDGKKEPELIVVDHLPVTLKDNKEKSGTATYYDIGKEASTKNVSIYTYRKGKAVLLKSIKYKKNLNIMANRRSGKLMIMDMKDGKTTYHFVSMSNGKIRTGIENSYRGNEYKIAVVMRASKAVIKKELKYETK